MQGLCRNGRHEYPGTGKCAGCRREAWQRYNRTAKRAAAQQRYEDGRKAAGLCPGCGEPAVPGEVKCVRCKAWQREYHFLNPG